MDRLSRLRIAGFKSIKDATLDLGPLTVVIGANGAGKSNLVSFFRMLSAQREEGLQEFIARSGFGSSLLHYGPKTTPQINIDLHFETAQGTPSYEFRLVHAAPDTLVFAKETVTRHPIDDSMSIEREMGSGHKESNRGLLATPITYAKADVYPTFYSLLEYRVYQFHDTSPLSRVRLTAEVASDRFLLGDAANLAPILLRYQKTNPTCYRRIVATVRQIAPFFGDFVLAPTAENQSKILLRWKERSSDVEFGPHQLSDGTLRAMALVTLLLQPEPELPRLLVIDEPELGLHPYAIGVLGSLLKSASRHCQILVATQSPTLVDQFDAENIVVADRPSCSFNDAATGFHRLEPAKLEEWLAEYSLSELWEKNVIGGRPE